MRHPGWLLGVVLCVGMVGAVQGREQAHATTSPTVTAGEERPGRTPAGSTFTIPADWGAQQQARLVELTAPEQDFRLAVVDVGQANDASAAARLAWQAWEPTQARPPKLVTARAPRDGWEERAGIDYEVSPNEKRLLVAVLLRRGKAWTALLADGAQASAEKRGAAIGLVLQSLRPANYQRESFAGRTAHPMDAARIQALQDFVSTSMRELGIPGVAFALTTREKTLYATGLGVRELGDPTPVDADTTFGIASNTKGMATLLLAKLVDEGKLRWDQPVTEVYPPFKLGSPQTTRKVLMRHLVCACTGLPRKDYEVLFNSKPDASAQDTFVQLAATEPTSGFGEVFQYNNLMASAAGYIGGHLAEPGMPLDAAFARAMQDKVWGPLGMTRTTLDFDRGSHGDWARPHADGVDGQPQPILDAGMKLNYAFTRYGAAGGAWSTANDMIRYVRFELNEGRLDDGTQYVSARNLLQRRVANVPIGEDRVYGMGLMVERDEGVELIHHGGSLAGYKTDILILPGANLGAVILTNADNGGDLLRPFIRRVLELVYDGQPEAAADVAAAGRSLKAGLAEERTHVSVVPDAKAVAALAPVYDNPDLGTLTVSRQGDGVLFSFRTLSTPMGTKRNDDGTTSFVMLTPTFLFEPMVVGQQGGKPTLTIRDGQHDYVFIAR